MDMSGGEQTFTHLFSSPASIAVWIWGVAGADPSCFQVIKVSQTK